MESIQQDLMRVKIQENKNEYQSLQDLCGQNFDGTFSDQLQFMYSNSTNLISIGSLSDII